MQWKNIIGLLLIIASIAAMFLWETVGRDRLLLCPVLVAAEDMEEGTTVEARQLKELRVPKDAVVSYALTGETASEILGRVTTRRITANEQLLPWFFEESSSVIDGDSSIYMLPASWIYSRTSALRAGDGIGIYAMPEKTYLGSFPVAFVRDSNEQAVVDTASTMGRLLGRTNTSSVIASVEIVCSSKDYFNIFDTIQAIGPGSLLLVLEDI